MAPETAENDPVGDAPTDHTHPTPDTAPSGSDTLAVSVAPASGLPDTDTEPASFKLPTLIVNMSVSSTAGSLPPAAFLLSVTR